MTETAAPVLAALPFASALLLVLFAVFVTWKSWHKDLNKRSVVFNNLWALPQLLLLVLLGGFCATNNVAGNVGWLEITAYSVALFICGVIPLCRTKLTQGIEKLPKLTFISSGVFVVAFIITFVSLVSAWIVDFAWMENSGTIQVQYVAVTAAIFAAAGIALYFLGNQTGALVVLVPLSAAGFGIAQSFLLQFKGMPLMPTDLLSLQTATAVAGSYKYVLSSHMVTALCMLGVCFCVLSFANINRGGVAQKKRIAFAVASILTGVTMAAGIVGLYNNTKLEDALGVAYDRWMPITTYQTLGLVPAFIEIAQDFPIPVPEDYSAQAAQEIEADLARQFDEQMGALPARQAAESQFNELKPTVIAVMNETFSDLSIYDGVREAGYEGPQAYKSLTGALQRGTLMVSVVGGGTANTEFEFLTGNSSAFIGTGKYPYQLYNLSEADSLVKQFNELGYTTTAMHPQNPVNWKRASVYKQLGFGEFLSQESFEGAPWYHSGATDASTYDKIIELLNNNAAPQFIFDVTMQNHSGYGVGSVPAEDMMRLNVPGIEDAVVLDELAVYLACINRSDEDFAYFIEQLKKVDRPVVLVFFGDHQPGLGGTLAETLYSNASPLEREYKKYESTYAVWANYEVAGANLDTVQETSSSQLAAQVLYAIGAPLTERQKAELMLGQSVASVNLTGYRGVDGLRYALDTESSYAQALKDMQSIQYLEFGEKVG